jgi:hypothetical protein
MEVISFKAPPTSLPGKQPPLTIGFCGLVIRISSYRSRGPLRFPALPYILRSIGTGTGSTQPLEYNWGATWKKSSGPGLENREYGRRYPSRWPRGTLYPQKLAINSPTSGGRSVGIVRSRTQATGRESRVGGTRNRSGWCWEQIYLPITGLQTRPSVP